MLIVKTVIISKSVIRIFDKIDISECALVICLHLCGELMDIGTHVLCVVLAPQEKASLTTVFKKSYEYEEIQVSLEPLLSKASNESRGTAPQYNTYFPWQVHKIYTFVAWIIPN